MLGYYFRNRLGLASGIAFAGSSLSQLVLPPLTYYLLEEYGLQGTMLIVAALSANVCVCGAAFFPVDTAALKAADDRLLCKLALDSTPLSPDEDKSGNAVTSSLDAEDGVIVEEPLIETSTPSSPTRNSAAHTKPAVTTARSATKRRRVSFSQQVAQRLRRYSVRRLSVTLSSLRRNQRFNSAFGCLKSPLLWILMFSYAIGAFIFSSLMKYSPPYALSHGVGREQVAFILALSGLPDLLARVGCGLVCDTKIVVRKFKRYRLFAVSLVLIAVACGLLPLQRTYVGFMLVLFLIGASTGMFFTMSSMACFDLMGPERYNVAFGWMMFLAAFAHIIDSVAVGKLNNFHSQMFRRWENRIPSDRCSDFHDYFVFPISVTFPCTEHWMSLSGMSRTISYKIPWSYF